MVIYVLVPFVDTFHPTTFFPSIVDSVSGIYLFTLSIASIVQGTRLLRIIKSFQVIDRQVIKAVTTLTMGASLAMATT